MSGDEAIECGADVLRRPRFHVRAAVAEEDEVDRVAHPFLVAQERLPRALTIDRDGLWVEGLDDRTGFPPTQPQGGEQAERHGLAVREVEVRGGLERVREGVSEV